MQTLTCWDGQKINTESEADRKLKQNPVCSLVLIRNETLLQQLCFLCRYYRMIYNNKTLADILLLIGRRSRGQTLSERFPVGGSTSTLSSEWDTETQTWCFNQETIRLFGVKNIMYYPEYQRHDVSAGDETSSGGAGVLCPYLSHTVCPVLTLLSNIFSVCIYFILSPALLSCFLMWR